MLRAPPLLILLDLITRTLLGEQYRSFSFSLHSFLHSPVPSTPLGPSILLCSLFSFYYYLFCVNISAWRLPVSHAIPLNNTLL
jgi:hypothetical protein